MKKIKALLNSIKYKLSFLGVLNSPFKGLKLKWYFGNIEHGTPYFLPRKWVKCNKEDALNSWNNLKNETRAAYEKYNGGIEHWTDYYIKNYTKPVQIKYFGFNFTTLGWKTKWDNYRFEWLPSISLVLFGKQLFIEMVPNIKTDDSAIVIDCYWEAWLNYKYKIDKSKSVEKRLEELQKEYSCNWGNKEKGYTNYYPIILKNKYHYLISEIDS